MINKLIKITLLPKLKAPLNIKSQHYFVEAPNESVAVERAERQLRIDFESDFIRYFSLDKYIAIEIDVIKS